MWRVSNSAGLRTSSTVTASGSFIQSMRVAGSTSVGAVVGMGDLRECWRRVLRTGGGSDDLAGLVLVGDDGQAGCGPGVHAAGEVAGAVAVAGEQSGRQRRIGARTGRR